jgi:hypothetical protein
MNVANVIAGTIITAYVAGGLGLRGYVETLRASDDPKGKLLPAFALFGASSVGFAFSGRHRALNDKILTSLVLLVRTAMILMPIGVWAFFAGG